MSDYYPDDNDVRADDLVLIVHQDGQDFGIRLGGNMSVGTVTAIDGTTCTVMADSGRSLNCVVFYDEPRTGDRVAVFADGGRNYAMIGLRSGQMVE